LIQPGLGGLAADVTLSDFFQPSLPPLSEANNGLQFHAEQYSLFDDMADLPASERLDVIMTTYGFDSVWLEKDAVYQKKNGKWYKQKNRIKVLPSHPNRDRILQALQTGVVTSDLTQDDFKSISVETALEEITSIGQEPYGKYLEERYKNATAVRISVPIGMVEKERI